jgi:DNA-directed RNA polymerase specialized sigma24 family protein
VVLRHPTKCNRRRLSTPRCRAAAFSPLGDDEFALDEPEDKDERNLCACFEALIPTLKSDYGELISGMELRGDSTAATAQRLGITLNNLKVRRHRARQALRGRLIDTCRMCAEHGCLDCTCQRT